METKTPAAQTLPEPAPVPRVMPCLTDVAAWLTDEIAETHAAIMGVHKFAAEDRYPDVQLNCMKAAARMMQAQAATAITLQRLMGGKGQTVTIIHEKRNTPPPEKLKTNRRQAPWSGVQEVWEDDEGVLWDAPPGTPGRHPVDEETDAD